ncbi:MAG: hypothetical protein OXF02_01590 [Simkaniaceae bacterium]|nr:hypothetical protein [Simkaniaceae bacterium]
MSRKEYVDLIDTLLAHIGALRSEKSAPLLQPLHPERIALDARQSTGKKVSAVPENERKPPAPPGQNVPEFAKAPPPGPPLPISGSESLKRRLQKIMPGLTIHDTIPSDIIAIEQKNERQEGICLPAIPVLDRGKDTHAFLRQAAHAISLHIASSRVIDVTPFEEDTGWDRALDTPGLRLILCREDLLFKLKALLPFYRESPGEKTRFLKKTPLLLLRDPSLYEKDPHLKRSLWHTLERFAKGDTDSSN